MVPAISLNDYEKKDCYGLKLSLNYWPVAATAQTSCVYNWHELGRLEPILLLFIRKPRRLGFFLPENQLYHLYGDGAMVLQGPRLRGDADGNCLLSLQTPGFTEIPANQQLTVSKVPLTRADQ